MGKWLAPVLVLPWLCICGGVTTAADNTDSVDLFGLSLEELSQVKVTVASRSQRSLREAAGLVTVFTDADMQRLGVRTLGELLGYVPGMRSYRNSGTSPWLDNYEVRGIRNDFNIMILLMVDGQLLNNPYNGGTGHMMQISLANAARVEIIRGPGSALYGSNALLGVVNIISRRDSNNAYVGVGNDNSREASVSASFAQDAWHGGLHANRRQTDGQRYDNIFDVTDRVDSARDAYRADDWQFHLGYHELELYGSGFRQQQDDFYQVNFVNPDNRTDQEGYEAGLRGKWLSESPGWQLNVQLSHAVVDMISYANRAGQGTPPFLAADWLGGFRARMERDTLTLDGGWQFDAIHEWSAGIRTSQEAIREASLYSNYLFPSFAYAGNVQRIGPLIPNVDRTILGFYLQGEQQWSSRWQTTIGIRRDEYRDFGGATSPRLAVQFYPTPSDAFKLLAGRAYRAPAFNELYTAGNPVTLGNPDLKPVRSRIVELLWLHEAPMWRIETSLFEQRINDQILSEFIAPGLRQFTNSGEIQVKGAEADLMLTFSPRWRSSAHLSWIADIEEQLGNSTGQDSAETNSPHRWGSVELNYSAEHWSWHVATNYVGRIRQLSEQGSYWLWRSHLRWSLARQLSLMFTVNNLFDKDFYSLSNLAGFGLNDDGEIERAIPGRGRELWLRLDWHW